MTKGSGAVAVALVFGLVGLSAGVAARRWRAIEPAAAAEGGRGTLVASLRAEPQSFNRYVARDLTSAVITYLMHGSLVRIDRATNQLEPELAESWELQPDRRTYRIRLRRNVRFSDGVPFTANDVVFSFQAIYDRKTASALADTLQVAERPLAVTAEDDSTVLLTFPSAFAPGLRMLDGVPMYPRHRLQHALDQGTFRKAWTLTTAPSDLAGLGPFMLERYEPGQRLVFARNPHYWRHGEGLPKLGRVVLEVLADQSAEALRLESGEIDLTQSEIRPADLPAIKRAAESGRLTLSHSGIGLDGDFFWINLSAATRSDPRSDWLQSSAFRRAIAASVDRRAFADMVYFGDAEPADSIVSPGNRDWHVTAPPPALDRAAAQSALASLALEDRNGDGMLEDRRGRAVRFTLLTQSGNTSLERGADAIKHDLARVGVGVDIVKLERSAMIDYVMRGKYDAAYFRLLTTDVDPALNLDFWLSSGGAHVWNPSQQSASTVWERQIDALMTRIATDLDTAERHAAFAEVQQIMARELPVICFAFPRVSIAVNTRVVGATPAPFRPPILWNPAVLDVRGH